MKTIISFITAFVFFTSYLARSQTIAWQNCLGGSDNDYGASIVKTLDGGYLVAGEVQSSDGDVSGNHGQSDGWLVWLSRSGVVQSQKCLGGSLGDGATMALQTADSGYIFLGTSVSIDGDVSGNHGGGDIWVVKLNSAKGIQWQKCLGGSNQETPYSLIMTSDGGHMIAGLTLSNNGNVSGNHGSADAWVVKLDMNGNIQWQKCYGGTNWDEANSVIQTADGGYLLACSAYSNDGDVSGHHVGMISGW